MYQMLRVPSWRLSTITSNLFRTNFRYAPQIMTTFVQNFYGHDLETQGRARFREQNELVRRKCAETPGRLLEWRVQDGWEPLCEFLGEQVPDVEFPNGNDAKGYQERLKGYNAFMGRDWRAAKVLWVIDHWVPVGLVFGVVGWGLYKRALS